MNKTENSCHHEYAADGGPCIHCGEQGGVLVTEKKLRKKRRASSYSLEAYTVVKLPGREGDENGWVEIKDGFVSPKAALVYAKKNEIEGVLRVVRVATPAYAYTLTPAKPVLTIEKVEVT